MVMDGKGIVPYSNSSIRIMTESFSMARSPLSPTALRLSRMATLLACTALLSACASKPSEVISLIPADQVDAQTRKDGLFSQPVKFERKKPECSGECASLKVESLAFPGNGTLTQLVDHALATMTGTGDSTPQAYQTIAEFEAHYWRTAAPRDEVILEAKTVYRNRNLTVLELNSYQYFTGAAHGISATQYLNWDNQRKRVLSLDDVLAPGGRETYLQALRQAHAAWLAGNKEAQEDPAGYRRLWPFQASDNFALTDKGVVVKYDAYALAPYSAGQPELRIPYSALRSALRPEFVPAAS